jgi:pentatricopeptide repeat protein
MQGQEDLIVGGIRAASWPRGESDGKEADNTWSIDTRCYNIVLAAASKMKSSTGLQIASELFDTMMDPKASKKEWADSAEAGRTALFRDAVSYNSMIAGYARAGRMQDAMDVFRSMKSCGLQPDRFTYTSLIKASVESGDVDGGKSILDDMESRGLEADVFAYNTVIKGLCDRFRWYEAKELVTEMEWNGVRPDSYTYGMLMNGLIKADKPGPALTLFETACADPRTVDVAQNVQIYTTAVTAASMMGDHARALGLVSRMVSAGVKPNVKTFTSLMTGCLSSGKTSYALDIFGKITEHDGLSLELGIRAFCDSGDFASATSILTEQRDGRREMSGKQVMASYNYIIDAALRQRKFDIARAALTELTDSGYIPSKQTFRTIPEALSLVPKKGKAREKVNDDNREESVNAFDFMLFVMDLMDKRKLPIAGSFYASVLFEGTRAGGLRRDVASLIAESKLGAEGGTLIDLSDTVECADEESCLGWLDVLENYSEYEGKGIALPTVRVQSDGKSIRSVLAAEQRVSLGRRRPKRAAV